MLSERMDQWEKDFYQNGYKTGIEKGIYQQQKSFLIRLLKAQSGTVSINTRKKIENLSASELEQWIDEVIKSLAAKLPEKAVENSL